MVSYLRYVQYGKTDIYKVKNTVKWICSQWVIWKSVLSSSVTPSISLSLLLRKQANIVRVAHEGDHVARDQCLWPITSEDLTLVKSHMSELWSGSSEACQQWGEWAYKYIHPQWSFEMATASTNTLTLSLWESDKRYS